MGGSEEKTGHSLQTRGGYKQKHMGRGVKVVVNKEVKFTRTQRTEQKWEGVEKSGKGSRKGVYSNGDIERGEKRGNTKPQPQKFKETGRKGCGASAVSKEGGGGKAKRKGGPRPFIRNQERAEGCKYFTRPANERE